MKDFLELAQSRFSVRKFKPDPVSIEQIEQILKAGQLAPTAHNNQPQRIIVVSSREGLEKLAKCTVCNYHAPLAFIISYDAQKTWVREYDGHNSGDVDMAIVTTHMMLEAQQLGLGSVWIMHFIPEAVRTEFEFPENIVPGAILMVGTADESTSRHHAERKDFHEYTENR